MKEELNTHEARIRAAYRINDAAGFVLDCEGVLCASPSFASTPSLVSVAEAAKDRLEAHSHPATKLLMSNLPLLRSELMSQLSYVVGGQSSREAVEDRHRRVFVNRVLYVAAAAVVLLIGLGQT